MAINNYFPNDLLWQFVDATQIFIDPLNPFPFSASIDIFNASDANDLNFIGMKLGDVNNSWDNQVNMIVPAGTIHFDMDQVEALPGDEIIVPVKTSHFENISGFQFTMEWNPEFLEFIAVENNILSCYFGEQFIADGKLTTLWYDESGTSTSLEDGATVFNLKFRATGSASESHSIEINSSVTPKEAVNNNLHILDIQSEPGTVNVNSTTDISPLVSNENVLFTNNPDPFWDFTNIQFYLKENSNVRFGIYNSTGQLVFLVKRTFPAGKNQIAWNGTDLQNRKLAPGIYFVKMMAGGFWEVERVILGR